MSKAESTDTTAENGVIQSVSGPVVSARDLDARMNDVVYVGDEGLMGGSDRDRRRHHDRSGVRGNLRGRPGEPVENTGEPLSVDLGPGMLDSIYDGVQRPLDVLEGKMGSPYLDRGVDAPGIDLEKKWEFEPTVEVGDEVGRGDVVGVVEETVTIDHKVMVPPDALEEDETTEVTAIEAGLVRRHRDGGRTRQRDERLDAPGVARPRGASLGEQEDAPDAAGVRSAHSRRPLPHREGRTAAIPGRSAPGRRSRSTSSRSTPTRTSSSTSAAASAATDDRGHRGLPRA